MHQYNARLVLTSSLFVILAAATAATPALAKPPIPYSVEDSWRSVSNATLSNDGGWVAYGAKPELGDGTLIVRSVQGSKEYREARAASAIEGQPDAFAFTYDNRYVVFSIDPPYADLKAARKNKKTPAEEPKAGLGILNLQTGEVARYDRVASFKLPAKRGNIVAILHEPALADAKAAGETTEKVPAELVVRNLASGTEQSIPNVVDYGLTSDGGWVTYVVKTPGKKAKTEPSPTPTPVSSASPQPNPNDGVYVRQVGSDSSSALLAGSAVYKNLTASSDHPQIAFISDLGTHAAKRPAWSLYYWNPSVGARAVRLVSPATPGVPAGYNVSDEGDLVFSKDGARLFVDLIAIAKAKPAPNSDPNLKVDIWWTKEPLLPTQQSAERMKPAIPGVVQLAQRRYIALGTKTINGLTHNENPHYAVSLGTTPYKIIGTWRYANCSNYFYCDVYATDMQTGNRRLIEARSWNRPELSPDGKYVAIFDGARHVWQITRTSDLHRTTLAVRGVHFESERWDQPDYPAAYGMMGWTPGDRSVLIYDHYDIWQFDPNTGAGKNVTASYGRSHHIQLRNVSLDPDAAYRSMPSFGDRATNVSPEKIDTSKPIVLLGMDENTKAESLYNFTLSASPAAPVLRTQQSVIFGAPVLAHNSSTILMTRERFDLEPDLYATNLQFSGFKRISDVEPRQQLYAWGRDQLINYTNADGVPLKAILYYPADFDAHKKYPMVEYEYEIKSDTLNEYSKPAPVISSEPNISWYASNGYVVLVPDIIYKIGHPGMSAVHCIVPAVKRVLSMGFVDPKRVGMTGHSWGGFQSMFLSTHSDIFAAFAGGAGISDLLSWNDEMRWGIGNPGMAHLEIFQGRMGGDLWHNFNVYLENSSVFAAPNEHAPFLTLHDDADSNVTWFQGIEFFNALRRLGKQAWLINYNGEDHGIYHSRDNQKDWTVRMDQFLAHYLKGSPAPDWMQMPILNEDRGSRVNVRKFDP